MTKGKALDISNILRKSLVSAVLFFYLFAAPAAHADCANPAATESQIIYNTTFQVFQYCDGTDWIAMHPVPGAGSGGCANPSHPEGRMIYNTTYRVMQGCAGNVWRGMGPVGGTGGEAPLDTPIERGSVSSANLDVARNVAVADGFAYVAANFVDSLTVVDISDPDAPVERGSVSSANLDGAWGVAVAGGFAYVAAANADALTVVDIADPDAPVERGSVSSANLDAARGVAAAGGFAYVASFFADSLTVVDIADPDAPLERGSVSSANLDGAQGVAVSGGFAYVTSPFADALTVVDIADPDVPLERGSVSSATNMNFAQGVAVAGGFAYVAAVDADSLTVLEIGSPPPGVCANPDRPEGALLYNSSSKVMQYCDGANWVAIGKAPADPCAGSPSPGDVCSDGSVYAGLSPDGNEPMYVADASTQVNRTWNNGTSNSTVTGFTSATDGDGNTAGLVSLADAGSPYEAAAYCDSLDAHGHQDWYLPAKDELNLLYNGGAPVAGVDTSGSWNWSSSESTSLNAWIQRFSDGDQSNVGKTNSLLVRCVRWYARLACPHFHTGRYHIRCVPD